MVAALLASTRVQGVIVNAGGIVAYYPSKFPLHHRAEALGDRDLYGELAPAAHEDGLFVFARMDSNRTHEAFYRAHPDWFAVDRAAGPIARASCTSRASTVPYYDEYIPGVLREIIERSHPEGITDNSWSGLDRESPCYCALSAPVSRPHRPAHPGAEGLGRPVVPGVDPLELRPPPGDLGPEQPHDAPGGRAALPLGRHEQRKRLGPGEPVPRLRGDRRPRRDPDARPPGAGRRVRLPGERRHRQEGPRSARLGETRPGEHGDVPGGPADVPPREQAGAGGSPVDSRGFRRRHSALVASRRRPARKTVASSAPSSR